MLLLANLLSTVVLSILVDIFCFHPLQLSNYLPSEAIGHEWVLIYSTFVHGISLRTLYRNMADVDTAVVLLVQDEFKKVQCALLCLCHAVMYGLFHCVCACM